MGKRASSNILGVLTMLSLLLGGCAPGSTPQPTETSPPKPTSSPTGPAPTPPAGEAAPIVVQRTPEPGAELPPDGAIELVFDRAMDRGSVEKALRVGPGVSGSVTWADEKTVSFKPARDLKRDEAYQVALAAEAQAADGTALEDDYGFEFRTVGYLSVSQVIPAQGAEDVEAGSTITVMFNRPVVPLTAISDPARSVLPQPLTLNPPVEGEGEWLNTSIYVFRPDGPLAGGTTYEARIEAGLTDTTGGLLEAPYTWEFSTQPPQVTWTSPSGEEELASVEPTVRVTFNMPVNAESAIEAFSLEGGGGVVEGEAEVVSDTLMFTPTEQLAFDTLYTARMASGVLSLRGGQGMPDLYTWQFQTVPLPRIIGTRPRDGEQNAGPHRPFEILFNTAIDPATVMPNVEMTPPLSPSQVYTYFSRHDNVFRMDFGSEPSSEYEVRIGPNISDPFGNKTGQELTVQYRTAPLDPSVQIDVPGMVGTFNAGERARVMVGHLNTDRVDVRLGRVEPDAYRDVRDRFWDAAVSYEPIRSWSMSVEAPLNEKHHTPIELVEGGGRLEPGLYVVEVRASGVSFQPWLHRRLVVVSDYNLTIKRSQDRIWVWATALETGEPAEGLELMAQVPDGEAIGPATSDADGLARFIMEDGDRGDAYVVSESPFVLGDTGWEWGRGISPWEFGLTGGFDERDYRVHITTDRPLYRAGQVVHFRGIVRAQDGVDYELPAPAEVQVRVRSVEGEEVYAQELELDDFGAFRGDLVLGDGAALGDYRIQAEVGGSSYGDSFAVAAYRPPEFEVLVVPEAEDVVAGTRSRAQVEVSYFFGGAVVDVDVEWQVLSSPYRFEPQQFGRYDFTDDDDPWVCRWCWWRPTPSPEVILEGTGTTDPAGQVSIGLPTEIMTGGHRLTVEATAYGKDGQAISGRNEIVVHRDDFYIGLAPQTRLGEAGEPFGVDAVTVDWDGTRVPDKGLNVKVYRREWVNTFVEREQGGRWEWETKDTLVHTDIITTDGTAAAELSFIPPEGGSYRVVAEKDGNDGSVDGSVGARTSVWVWVSGAEDVSWRRENDDQFDLVSDKGGYVPGETAEILIPSPFEGEQWAWITVERGGVMDQEVRRLESNSSVYRLPITADHAPNIYVSVVLVKGPDAANPAATHKVGILPLTVEPVEQTLNLTLTPSVQQAEPGDSVRFDVHARDANGEPVEAAFSLDLVDKAVLSLRPREDDAIVQAFYGRRGLGVSTSSGLVLSINRLLLKQVEELENLATQGLGIGGGGEMEEEVMAEAPARAAADESAEGSVPDAQVREEFEDTAFWKADVVTDEEGRASVDVALPDNLTTWVFRAVGVTKATEVGEETTELLVTKPLLVRPTTPRFFVVGDRSQLAALVSNNTGATRDVEVTLQAEGLTVDGDLTRNVQIPDGTEREVTWWVEVDDVEQAEVVMGAVSGEYADAARPRLTTGPDGSLVVNRYTAPEIAGTGGQLEDEGARAEAVALPPNASDRKGELSVRLDPSLAAGMTGGLDYLEHYPYECTEQIVSRFLPNVLSYRAVRELGLERPALEDRLPGLVQEALDKLYKRQNGDGGWGWWDRGDSRVHLTAYAVFGMVKAREAGFDVRGGVMERGLSYLRTHLEPARDLTSPEAANQQAFILYVMTEAGDASAASEYTGGLYDSRDKLSHYGRAYLAMALDMIKEPEDGSDERIGTLLSDLQNAAILSATGAHWEEEGYDRWAMNTDTRSTAVILKALAQLDPENDLIPNVVRWLMVAREDGIWETTYETAWALIALTDWMRVTGELEGNYAYGLWFNERLLEEGQVTPANVDMTIRRQIPVSELLEGASNRLIIDRGPGEGRLYYTAHLRTFLPVEEIEPLNRGIIVSRQYSDPACMEGVECPALDEVEVGDVVQVRLTIIAPHDLTYVVVEDPLPAGGEAIDTSLATTSLTAGGPTLVRQAENEAVVEFYRWWWNWYSRSEMRDDRVVLFADYLPAGTYEYIYTFRATRPGDYHVIPTTAREFYFPEVFGRGAGRMMRIRAGD